MASFNRVDGLHLLHWLIVALILCPFVVGVEDEELVAYRLARGQVASGGPFYSDPSPSFDAFVTKIKEIEPTSDFSRETMSELHETFIKSHDSNGDIWDGWAQVCALIEALSDIKGCLDAPEPLSGWRATHTAAMHGHVEKLGWLIRMGANLDATTAPNSKGLTHTALSPAHLAALYNQPSALAVLKAGGAKIYQKSPGGYTPLDIAIEKGNVAAAQWLRSDGLPTRKELMDGAVGNMDPAGYHEGNPQSEL